MIKSVVPDGVKAMPLSRYLGRAYPMVPGWAIRDALKNRDVRVNGVRVSGGTVDAGSEITAYIPDKYLPGALDVIYSEGGLLVIDKPAGLPVDADADGIGDDTVLTRAKKLNPQARLCHRLDVETSGVMILATTDEAYETALAAFKTHGMKKIYECRVLGNIEPYEGTITNYLKKDAQGAKVIAYDFERPNTKKATLKYRTLETDGMTSRLEVELITGRTHQIRVQLSKLGHPLLGDDKYGDYGFNKAHSSRLELWCKSICYMGRVFQSRGHL